MHPCLVPMHRWLRGARQSAVCRRTHAASPIVDWISADAARCIFDMLTQFDKCMEEGPLVFEPATVASGVAMAISCAHFRTTLADKVRALRELKEICDKFVRQRIDGFSQHADHISALKMDYFLAEIAATKDYGICSRGPMRSCHLQTLSETLGAGGMRALEVLDLSGGSSGLSGGAATERLGLALPSLARAAQKPMFAPNLAKLYLADTGVDDFGLLALLAAAAEPGVLTALRKLDLSGNHVRGDRWPEQVAKARLPSLKMLDLGSNQIRGDAIVALARAISNPGVLATLERLGLHDNRYRNQGLKALTRALTRGALPSLKQLTTIVNAGDPHFEECKAQVVREMKQAMVQRRIVARRQMSHRGRVLWISSLDIANCWCDTSEDEDRLFYDLRVRTMQEYDGRRGANVGLIQRPGRS